MRQLIAERFDRVTFDFFADYDAWEPWRIDRKQARWIAPVWQDSKPSVVLKLPEQGGDNIRGVTGFVSRRKLMDREGGLLIVVDFIPHHAGVTGEHFGLFLRVHNPDLTEAGERFGVAVQSSRNHSGQCEGSEAFLQLTGRLKNRPEVEYGHQCCCFKLKEDVFGAGLNQRYRMEFEEKLEGGVLKWEGRVYRHGFWGWSLRGRKTIAETELEVYTPSLPAGVAVGFGPGFAAQVDVESIRAERSETLVD